MVAENKLETNYPCTPCCLCGGCDCCVYDNIQTVYFDQLNDNWKRVTCCSPYHWFCCCECSGGVAATTKSYAPECCLNCPCCWCCFTYIPGVENADEFVAHMKNAGGDVRGQVPRHGFVHGGGVSDTTRHDRPRTARLSGGGGRKMR